MRSVPIKLSFAEEVKTFVNTVNRYPYEVDLRAGRHVVDAKSILGIFSLDLSKPITMDVYDDHFEGCEQARAMAVELEALDLPEHDKSECMERMQAQLRNAREWRDILNTFFHRFSGVPDEQGRTIYD